MCYRLRIMLCCYVCAKNESMTHTWITAHTHVTRLSHTTQRGHSTTGVFPYASPPAGPQLSWHVRRPAAYFNRCDRRGGNRLRLVSTSWRRPGRSPSLP